MSITDDIGVIDLMLAIPGEDSSHMYDFMKPLLMDEQSKNQFKMPAQYMFKNIPELGKQKNYIDYTIAEMDKYNIQQAMIGIDENRLGLQNEALLKHPQRFFGSYECNPNNGMEEVRKIRRLHQQFGIKAVTAFPSGLCPQVPLNDKRWFPIFVACIDLGIPFCPCVGVPGPRLPMYPQKVEHLDEICWFFPELKVVMRHGGEPWAELACKLMLKYPNLYYMTSAFLPKYYPESIINFANSRGGDQVMYAGYFPMGLSLKQIFAEMANVPFKKSIWPKFLRDNAETVFQL